MILHRLTPKLEQTDYDPNSENLLKGCSLTFCTGFNWSRLKQKRTHDHPWVLWHNCLPDNSSVRVRRGRSGEFRSQSKYLRGSGPGGVFRLGHPEGTKVHDYSGPLVPALWWLSEEANGLCYRSTSVHWGSVGGVPRVHNPLSENRLETIVMTSCAKEVQDVWTPLP